MQTQLEFHPKMEHIKEVRCDVFFQYQHWGGRAASPSESVTHQPSLLVIPGSSERAQKKISGQCLKTKPEVEFWPPCAHTCVHEPTHKDSPYIYTCIQIKIN